MTDNKPNIGTNKPAINRLKPRVKLSPLGKKLLIRGESGREFEQMSTNLLKEMDPQTEMENILCEKIISAQWKIGRFQQTESRSLSTLNAPDDSMDQYLGRTAKRRVRSIKGLSLTDHTSQTLLKIQFELENTLYAALKALRKEQELRRKGKKV